jgi:hypothetical protein
MHLNKNLKSKVLIFPLFLLVLWVFTFYFFYSLVVPPSFDGGLNLNVAKSLATGKGYGSYYNNFELFPQKIQTNIPYIGPAAFVYAIGGVNIFTSQFINFLYLIFFGLMLYAVLRKIESISISILCVFFALQVPGIEQFGMSGYGEIPALSYLMLGLLLLTMSLERDSTILPFSGGVALAFSYLTKTVALLWVFPTAGIYALMVLVRGRPRMQILMLCAGFMVPVIGWEFYRFISLGGSQPYMEWWFIQLKAILSRAGAHSRLHNTPGIISKAIEHFNLLSKQTHTPVIFILTMWILPLPIVIFIIVRSWNKIQDRYIFLIGSFYLVATLYLIWWIFLTPTAQAWLRRILNGLVLQQVLSILILSFLIRWVSKFFIKGNNSTKKMWSSKWYAVPLLSLIILVGIGPASFFIQGKVIFRFLPSAEKYSEFFKMTDIVSNLPDEAHIFGYGWWEAPVIALFSNRNIDNLQKWKIRDVVSLPAKYLVCDTYFLSIAPDVIAQLRKIYYLNPIYISNSGAVFNIMGEKPLKAQIDGSNTDFKSFVALDSEDYLYLRGAYKREGKIRWASPEVRILLWRTSENFVSAEVTVPPGLMNFKEKSEGKKNGAELTLFSENCSEASLFIPKPGRYRISAPINCESTPSGAPFEILIALNSQLDPRDISPDIRSLAFRLHTVELY